VFSVRYEQFLRSVQTNLVFKLLTFDHSNIPITQNKLTAKQYHKYLVL